MIQGRITNIISDGNGFRVFYTLTCELGGCMELSTLFDITATEDDIKNNILSVIAEKEAQREKVTTLQLALAGEEICLS